jgi:hypothetical protein
MGVKANIAIDQFPKQGNYLNREVNVIFHFNTNETISGVVVRDDTEEPGIMIIRLADDRYVLATECQYQLKSS